MSAKRAERPPDDVKAWWQLYAEHLHGRNPLGPGKPPPVNPVTRFRRKLEQRSAGAPVELMQLGPRTYRVFEQAGYVVRRG
jgi:hypothetical protein